MAKKKIQPESWPYRIRLIYVLLGISLIANVAAIASLAFIFSPAADYALVSHTLSRVCDRDYDQFMQGLRRNDPTGNAAASFSEGLCTRDANNGQQLSSERIDVVNGHLQIKLPNQ